MINQESKLAGASRAPSASQADYRNESDTFYDRVRRRFLRQSARYLSAGRNPEKDSRFPDSARMMPL